MKNITFLLLRVEFTTILFFVFLFSEAQKTDYVVKGTITSDSAKAVIGSNVKVVSKRGLILAFENTGQSNSFSINIPFAQDSITLFVSHSSYQTFVSFISIDSNRDTIIPVILLHKTDTLEKITIMAPPVWVRGDTTFFRAEYYKMGDEIKLKDLITKMPGFEIDANGNLLYRKQTVDKIMVDGNDLFSDKLQLLVDNFPVHVINTIQAIENQAENKLLKGLSSKKLFINIGLKNEKLKATFGDGEAGIGSENKYLISPVLFSLFNKVKMGYIGTWNSLGTGIGVREEDELKNENIRDAEKFVMNTHSLRLINDLDISSYIVNQEFNNRLQINFPLSKQLNSKTEIGFFKDRQRQVATTQSVFFTDKDLIQRRDSNYLEYRPSVFSLGENLTWEIDSTSQIIIKYLLFTNNSGSIVNTLFNQQDRLDQLFSKIKNNWKSNNVKLSYTKRVSETKATTFTAEFSKQSFPQSSDEQSESWPSIFQLPDSSYEYLHTNSVNHFEIMKAGWQTVKKISSAIFSYGITGSISNAHVAPSVFFNSIISSSPQVKDSLLSNSGTYSHKTVNLNLNRQINFFKSPLSVRIATGISKYTVNDKKAESYFIPIYEFSVNQRFQKKKTHELNWSVTFGQKGPTPQQLNTIYIPSTTVSFYNNKYAGETFKYFHVFYSMSFFNHQKGSASSIFLSYNHDFSSIASKTNYDQFLSLTTNVVSPLSTHLLYFSYRYSFFSRPLRVDVTLGTDLNASQRALFYRNNIIRNKSVNYDFSLALKKKFRNKNYIELHSRLTSNSFLPAKELKDYLYPSVFSLNTNVTPKFTITKKITVKGNFQWFEQNIFTKHRASFLFCDAELFYHVKDGWFISLKAQNLLNEKFYYSVNNYGSGQSFYTVPLVPRSALVSVRFEL